MNDNSGYSAGMDPMALLQYLQQQPGGLEDYFTPYQQYQEALDKGSGAQHTSPLGALLGGLSDVGSRVGGGMLGKMQQADAAHRLQAMLQAMNQQKSMGAAYPDLEEAAELGG